jgi:NADH-quinone oxidoreductase subunit L
MNLLDFIWLIPLFPLAGAAVMLLLGRKLPNSVVTIVCPGAVFISFILAAGAVAQLAATPTKTYEVVQFLWVPALRADWGFYLDPLSSVMVLIITGIGLIIHFYAIGYMVHEGGYSRFFGYLNLFVFFMLMLVLANNYVLLFLGWEGVGLCSYLLIGFYYHRKSAADAGKKAFIVNRVGDAAFIIGILLLSSQSHSVRFTDVLRFHAAPETAFGVISVTTLLLFIGATGKSAQFPLHVWLPDAMEGPTPVSALIHAATMVTAGVYVVARSHTWFELTPLTLSIMAVVGAFTAIFAASIALVQNDIKRVLAYSTISQLGYMFLAAGVGAYWVAVFHLFTHAFFKALLFLGAGSVIHALDGEQDMRKMGGLRVRMPITYGTMLIGTLAIAGIPGLAGFFSKDEILAQVYGSARGSTALYTIGLITTLMTAFYMWRLMSLTFYGERRSHKHAHESPAIMTAPLAVLAFGSAVVGWLAVPKGWGFWPQGYRVFDSWLEHVFGAEKSATESPEALLTSLSVIAALAGIWLARQLYLKTWEGPLYRALLNKWYVDETYDFVFVNGIAKGGGIVLSRFDRNVIDGGIDGTGWLTRGVSRISIWWDTWVVDGTVRLIAFAAKLAGYTARTLQTGSLQSYALVFFIGLLAFVSYYATR